MQTDDKLKSDGHERKGRKGRKERAKGLLSVCSAGVDGHSTICSVDGSGFLNTCTRLLQMLRYHSVPRGEADTLFDTYVHHVHQ